MKNFLFVLGLISLNFIDAVSACPNFVAAGQVWPGEGRADIAADHSSQIPKSIVVVPVHISAAPFRADVRRSVKTSINPTVYRTSLAIGRSVLRGFSKGQYFDAFFIDGGKKDLWSSGPAEIPEKIKDEPGKRQVSLLFSVKSDGAYLIGVDRCFDEACDYTRAEIWMRTSSDKWNLCKIADPQ